MPTSEQIARARETCKAMQEKQLRRRRMAIETEIFAITRIGEQSDAASSRLDMLETAARIINAELRERHERELM